MCTLSSGAMVERVKAFAAEFAAGLIRLEREPLRLRLTFEADAGRRAELRELFALEQQCCGFLTFAYQDSVDGLVVEMTAPEEAGPTLDGMQALAERSVPPEIVARGWVG